MTDPKLETQEARQGQTGVGVRWVLIISTALVIVGFGLVAAIML